MKFSCTLENILLIIRDRFGLSFASKILGYLAALLLLLPLLARYKLPCYQTTLLLTISALADITLLRTTCHFLLLLLGFDTLTYRKGYNWSHILVGHHHTTSQHALQKQVRRPLLCCCNFYVDATGLSKNQSYLRIKTTTIVCQVGAVLTFARTGRSHT